MINIVIILFIVYKIKECRNMQNKTNIKCCLLATVSSITKSCYIVCHIYLYIILCTISMYYISCIDT